jgi:hypothetical protein
MPEEQSSRSISATLPAALTAASVLLLVASFVGGAVSEWVFVTLAPLFPVLLMMLATRRPGARAGLLALGALLMLTVVGIRLFDGASATGSFLGLPLSAIAMGLGLVVVPLILLGWGFVIAFDGSDIHSGRKS